MPTKKIAIVMWIFAVSYLEGIYSIKFGWATIYAVMIILFIIVKFYLFYLIIY